MNIVIAIVIFAGYHGLNVVLAAWNSLIVANRIKKGNRRQIEHFWWGLGYGIICYPQHYIFGWWFVAAIILLHLSIFGPYYSHYRGFDWFNLSRSSKAITEKAMVRIGLKSTEPVVFIAEFLALVFFTISLLTL